MSWDDVNQKSRGRARGESPGPGSPGNDQRLLARNRVPQTLTTIERLLPGLIDAVDRFLVGRPGQLCAGGEDASKVLRERPAVRAGDWSRGDGSRIGVWRRPSALAGLFRFFPAATLFMLLFVVVVPRIVPKYEISKGQVNAR